MSIRSLRFAGGMDYNANINWIVAGLPDGRKLNVINSFYVKFERHGWTVEAVYIGNPMRHDEKYLLINQAFAGKQATLYLFTKRTALYINVKNIS